MKTLFFVFSFLFITNFSYSQEISYSINKTNDTIFKHVNGNDSIMYYSTVNSTKAEQIEQYFVDLKNIKNTEPKSEKELKKEKRQKMWRMFLNADCSSYARVYNASLHYYPTINRVY